MPSFPTIRTVIAGVAVADLARQFGTPTYVYDAAKIVERINDLRRSTSFAMPKRPARIWRFSI